MPENAIRFGGPGERVNDPIETEEVEDADSAGRDDRGPDGDDDDLDAEDGDPVAEGDEIDDNADDDEEEERTTFTVSIEGPGLQFSRVIDGVTALSIMGIAMGQGGSI